MIRVILFFMLLVTTNVTAQINGTAKVKAVIDTFFEGFHKQDSLIIMQVVSSDIIMQSISENREGDIKVRNQDFGKFLKSIVSIPKDKTFEEKLLDYNVEDVIVIDDIASVICALEDLESVKKGVEAQALTVEDSTVEWVAKDKITLDDKEREAKVFKFLEALEEIDDVQSVYVNLA